MKLPESGQMYLETIYVLYKEKPTVHSIDVSEHMGYSKPSVSRAIGLLRTGGGLQCRTSSYAENVLKYFPPAKDRVGG